MDRRDFLGVVKDLGLAGAIGIPMMGVGGAVRGDAVEVAMTKGGFTDKMDGFRLFADPSADLFGVFYQGEDKFLYKNEDRSQIPLSKALQAVRDGAQPEVRLVTVPHKGPVFEGEPARLYVDRYAGEFGLRSPNGDETVFIPLASVVELFKKAGLL